MVDDVKNELGANSLADYLVVNFPEFAEELCDHLVMQLTLRNELYEKEINENLVKDIK
jgi:hypothetical protein